MTDIGISCSKESYGRTAGTPLVCKPDEDEDAALCYTPCNDGFHGEGPVCWEDCPDGTNGCGALCLVDGETCTSELLDESKLIVKAAIAFATGSIAGGIIDIAALATDLPWSNCPNPSAIFFFPVM